MEDGFDSLHVGEGYVIRRSECFYQIGANSGRRCLPRWSCLVATSHKSIAAMWRVAARRAALAGCGTMGARTSFF